MKTVFEEVRKSMTDTPSRRRLVARVKFFVVLELALFVLAMIGPGDRVGPRRSHRNAIVGFWVDDPTFWEATVVNFLALNLFVAIALTAAVVVGRRRRGRRNLANSPDDETAPRDLHSR